MNEDIVKLSVYAILVDREGKILLQKRANTRFANDWWSFPGGHVEDGEQLLKAVQRELHEECKIMVSPEQYAIDLTLLRKSDQGKRYVNFFSLIKDWAGTPTIADGKASALQFFSHADIPEKTLPYIKEALQLIEKRISFYESNY